MKEFVLSHIRKISAEDLVQHIIDGTVAFDELRETGGFVRQKQDTVSAIIEEINKKQEREIREQQERERKERAEAEAKAFKNEQAWQTAKHDNSIRAYEYYQEQYPNGKYYDNADRKIYFLREEIENQKQHIIRDIKENPREYTSYKLQALFNDGKLTKEDLYNNDIITEKALNLFLNPPQFQSDLDNWSVISEPLKPNRTDVYFFGILGSGKSCLLGGVLHFAKQAGHLEIKGNGKGVKYGNSLIRNTKMGYVAPPTPIQGANYIEATLTDSDNIEHAINIIEMSGEMVRATYELESTQNVEIDGRVYRTIGSNDFLHNDNKKIIFFIIDYKETIDPYVTRAIADQSAQLEYTLSLLDGDGVLAKTADIYIVLTKSDLLPGGADNLVEAEAFVEKEYKALWNNTKRYGRKHKFDVKVLTFSLGEFMLGTTFNYESKYSENIYNAIIASSFVEKKKGFGSFFK
jgi:hypothetical protein